MGEKSQIFSQFGSYGGNGRGIPRFPQTCSSMESSLVPSPTSGCHFLLTEKVGLVLICRILGCESADLQKPIRLQSCEFNEKVTWLQWENGD